LDDALAAAGLTFVKWRVLDTLAKAGTPIPLKLLPEQLGCVKSNVTQLIDKLEADETVRRVPDPDDRRGTRVELTAAGHSAHQAGRIALEAATHSLFMHFERDEQESLRSLLRTLDGPTA
jgi:DNA-binding MarR family transcriptional regulator